jgi:D-alanyl-D-alanine carboxypeptidase
LKLSYELQEIIPPFISAKSWGLVDLEDGQEIYGSFSKKQLEIASLTKIMTSLTALKFVQKNNLHLDKISMKVTP